MLKRAMYCNVFLILIISIILMIMTFKNKRKKENLRPIIITYLIYTIISNILYSCGMLDIGWDLLFLQPISIITIIINIISVVKTNKNKEEKIKITKYILYIILPILMFIIPYSYELYIINNCDYLIKYNYQSGIVISEDSYLAVMKDKVVNITLQNNILGREGRQVEVSKYDALYKEELLITTKDENHDEVIVENEKLNKIAHNIKNKEKNSKSAYIQYFQEEDYAIITLLDDEGYGSVLGEYLYSNNKYIKINTPSGDIEEVIYYK